MRILYVYREYGGRRRAYGRIMSDLGHIVKYVRIRSKFKPNQIRKKHIVNKSPDIVWLLQPSFLINKILDPDALQFMRSKGVLLVTYGTFPTETCYTSLLKYWKKFDFLFVHNLKHHKWLSSKGVKSYYMPIGFHTGQYPQLTCNYQPYDVSFMGRPQTQVRVCKDNRVKYINALADRGIRVWGKGYNNRGLKPPGIWMGSYAGHGQQREVYSMSKINLDLPFVNSTQSCYRKYYHIKNRFFEIPATNNFMLTLKTREATNIFGEDCVGYYEKSIESLCSAVDKYMKNEKLRRQMAQKACSIVHEKHSFRHRFEEMFNIICG